MSLPPSAFATTVSRVSSHKSVNSGNMESSEEIRCSQSRIEIPTDLMPYLTRVRTKDIVDHLNDEGGHSEATSAISREHLIASFRKLARRLLRMNHFDSFMGLVIVLNLIVMIVEIDRSVNLEDSPAAVLHWTEVFGLGVLVIFLLELLLRLVVLQWTFFKDAWNVFDFIVVSLDAAFSVVELLATSIFPVSVLRICRLAKLARVFKVLRVFPELRLLLAGLISSISAIFWGAVLLFFFMLLWALVAVLIIHPLNATIEYNSCERCPRAYSSVMQAVLTFWQSIVAGDSWGASTIPVMEKYPSTAIFFVAVYLSVGMAVVNLILGVVVNVAQQALASLSEEDKFERALVQLGRQTQLLDICKDMDSDADGQLSQEELYAAFEKEGGEFRDTIDALGISKDDFKIVWSILDGNNDGFVSYKELVSRLASIRTSETEYMLNYIKHNIKELKDTLMKKLDLQHAETLDVECRLGKRSRADILQASQGAVHGDIESDFHDMTGDVSQVRHEVVKSIVQHGHTETGKSMTSSNDRMQAASNVTSLHNDIEMLRMELKGVLMDMERKFDEQHLHPPAKDVRLMSMKTQSDLLVLPSTEAFHAFRPQCCGAPARDRSKETFHILRPQHCVIPARDRGAIDIPSGSSFGLGPDGSTTATSSSTLWPSSHASNFQL